MARRINSELLLVGSLPATSTEESLRAGGELFGDLVFALPDGETGPRAMWAAYEYATLLSPNPGLELVREDLHFPPRVIRETAVLKVREGVTELRFESWPRIDDAIESYQVFKTLREHGVIPADVRFQVSLPFAVSALVVPFKETGARDIPIALRAYEDLFAREIKRLTAAIPADDLAIQWDVCTETQDIEGVLGWMAHGDPWERFAGPVRRITRLIPEETLVGYHLCYGTFGGWPMYEPKDMGVIVQMANYAMDHSGRQVDWLHLAGPGTCAATTTASFSRCAACGQPTPASSSGSSCRSTGSTGSTSAAKPPPGTSTTSASRCTAASAASPGKTAWRRCASTATSSVACAGDRTRALSKRAIPRGRCGDAGLRFDQPSKGKPSLRYGSDRHERDQRAACALAAGRTGLSGHHHLRQRARQPPHLGG